MMEMEIQLPSRYSATPTAPSFDYAALAPADADKLREVADAIRSHTRRASRNIMAVGSLLLAVKQGLGHGAFGNWLADEFDWNERTAQRFMQAAEAFGSKSDTVSELPPTAIYLLSAPSTPEPVRAAVVERLERRERVPVDTIREMVAEAREAEKLARAVARRTPEERIKLTRKKEREQREREKHRSEFAEQERRELAARKEAAEMIMGSIGSDAARLIELLDIARYVYAADLRNVVSPSLAARRMSALPA